MCDITDKIIDIDAVSRDRIISDINTNFFVEAGAGSGKTTMLVNRMVAMVEQGIDIDKICAITFTKAAAGEFRNRFQTMLTQRADPNAACTVKGLPGELPAPTEITRERCRKALDNIDLCFMGTIDSFCNQLIREHPGEAGIPSDSVVVEDDEFIRLCKQVYVAIGKGKYDGINPALKDKAEQFGEAYVNPAEAFAYLIKAIYERRNYKFGGLTGKPIDIDKDFAAERKELINIVDTLMNHQEWLSEKSATGIRGREVLMTKGGSLKRPWSYNLSGIISTINGLTEVRLYRECDGKSPVIDSCLDVPKRKNDDRKAEAYFKNLTTRLKEARYQLCLKFAVDCLDIVEKEVSRTGNLTYFDALYFLKQMLGKDAAEGGKLIRYINSRHRYYLIDESQDTNPMQSEIFFYLASDKPEAEWNRCIPRPGSLFIVGDRKQSIYRFRGADVAAFLRVRKLFVPPVGEVLQLTRNFRSTRTLCEYYNRIMPQVFKADTTGENVYEPIPLPTAVSGFQGVYTYNHPEALYDAEGTPMELSDAQSVYAVIKALTESDRYNIYDESIKGTRTIRYGDIMIIPTSKPSIAGYTAELTAHGIPSMVEGKQLFTECDSFMEIYNIYKATTGDEIALYTALTGRTFGLTEEDILKYKMYRNTEGKGLRLSLYQNFENDGDDPAVKPVAEAVKRLQEVRKMLPAMTPAAAFEYVMEHFEVFGSAGTDNMEMPYYILELLRNGENTGEILSHEDAIAYMEQQVVDADNCERCLSFSQGRNCVHIANLHKVKGLEAPVVILPWCNKPPIRLSEHVDIDNGTAYIFSVKKKEKDYNYVSLVDTGGLTDMVDAEKNELAAENLRKIYVAATRAKNALIISFSGDAWTALRDGVEPGDFFDNKTPEEIYDPGQSVIAVVDDLYKKADAECIFNDRSAEEATYRIENPSRAKLPSKLAQDRVREEYTVSMEGVIEETNAEREAGGEAHVKADDGVHKFPALLGTMTHRLMEFLVTAGCGANTDVLVERVIDEYITEKALPYRNEFVKALQGVAAQMKAGGYAQNNGAPADILAVLRGAEKCCCEVPFCYKEDNVIWNGVMDVIYKADGRWYIIDYKTNADGTDLDRHYAGQLEAYKKALASVTGEEVADALIYHIDI